MIRWLAAAEAYFTRRSATIFAIALLPLSVAAIVLKTFLTPAGFSAPLWGNDFVPFWGGIQLFRSGGSSALFDPVLMEVLQGQILPSGSLLLWHYPPTFLAAIWPLGWLTVWQAFAVFTVISICIWLIAAWLFAPAQNRLGFFFVFGAPAATVCLLQGQNGIITAALFGGALLARSRNHLWISALCMAGLLVKPHLGLLIPIALLAAKDWRLIWRAAFACGAFIALTLMLFGADTWMRFFSNSEVAEIAMLSGDLWAQQPGVFAFLSLLGVPYAYALLAHGVAGAVTIFILWTVWSDSQAPLILKHAMLLSATLMITPFAFRYDMTISLLGLACIAAFLQEDGWRPGDKAIAALLWLAPALMPIAVTGAPVQIGTFALIGQIAFLWLILRRDAQSEEGEPEPPIA